MKTTIFTHLVKLLDKDELEHAIKFITELGHRETIFKEIADPDKALNYAESYINTLKIKSLPKKEVMEPLTYNDEDIVKPINVQ